MRPPASTSTAWSREPASCGSGASPAAASSPPCCARSTCRRSRPTAWSTAWWTGSTPTRRPAPPAPRTPATWCAIPPTAPAAHCWPRSPSCARSPASTTRSTAACVPTSARCPPPLSPINLNALDEDDAALLAMLTDGELTPETVQRLLRARPAGGWNELPAFWAQPTLAGITPSDAVRNQVRLRSRYFALQAEVEYAGAQAVTSALFENDAGATRLVSRRLAPLE